MNTRSLLVLTAVVACSGKIDSAARADSQRAPSTAAVTPMAATAAPTMAAAPPPRPDTGAVSAESALPHPSYEGVPGWLVMGGRGFPRHIGDSTDADPRAYTGIDIDSGIVIFPDDERWGKVGTATPLALLEAGGPVTLFPGGFAEANPYTPATLLRVRSFPPVEVRKLSIGWMLPASRSARMTALAIRDSISPDSSTRSWTMDSVRFRVRLTGKLKAAFWAVHIGRDSTLLSTPAIDSAADSGMGVESDSVLTLDSWQMPRVVAAFRLGNPWPVVAVIFFSGYECSNHSVVVFRASSITPIEDPHYYECAR